MNNTNNTFFSKFTSLTLFTFFTFLTLFTLLISSNTAYAQTAPELNLFYSETCPHCSAEREFLSTVIAFKYQTLKINEYSISDKENVKKLVNFYKQYNVNPAYAGMVPVTFIGDRYILGYNEKDGSTNSEIESAIKALLNKEAAETPAETHEQNNQQSTPNTIAPTNLRTIKLPIIGEINAQTSSPLTLSVVFGALDGFNACAMMALGLLLTILIGSGDRKKIIIVGGTFIAVSGLVYFVFMAAWLNLFLVVQHIALITVIVSLAVIIFSLLMLKDFFYGIICKLCNKTPDTDGFFQKMERNLLLHLQKLTSAEVSTSLLLIGVSLVAAGINLVEIICSFGFPMAFTKALTAMNLSTLSYYGYMLIYIFFYMLDDLIIFLIAVFTMRLTGVSSKYLKHVKLISALLLLILGLILLIKPSLLTFTL